jgi:hypothetical protein
VPAPYFADRNEVVRAGFTAIEQGCEQVELSPSQETPAAAQLEVFGGSSTSGGNSTTDTGAIADFSDGSLSELEWNVRHAVQTAMRISSESSPMAYIAASSPLRSAWRALSEYQQGHGGAEQTGRLRDEIRDALRTIASRCHGENEGRRLTNDRPLTCPSPDL